MPDIIDTNGTQVKTYNELLAEIQQNYNDIYAKDGNPINFGSETPDGQQTNILAQIGTDIRELIVQVDNDKDPSKVNGVQQDSLYQINYITRKGGTFTIQNIDVTVDRTVELQGLDANYNSLDAASYAVSDNVGNIWYLVDTTTLESGTHSLPFRSKNLGLVQPTIGTIINQVTIVLGVVSVNNSVAPTTLGVEQESDAEFRLRRDRSTETRSQNSADAILSNILGLDSVSDATIWENREDVTDSTGTLPHYIWVIVEGGANSDIANVIYANGSGAGTRGEITVDIPSVSGQIVPISFDRPAPIPLYIQFDFKLLVDVDAVNFDGIKEYIAENLIYKVDEDAETSKITAIESDSIIANGGGGYALNTQISLDGITWTDYIPSASKANKFVIDVTRITINQV